MGGSKTTARTEWIVLGPKGDRCELWSESRATDVVLSDQLKSMATTSGASPDEMIAEMKKPQPVFCSGPRALVGKAVRGVVTADGSVTLNSNELICLPPDVEACSVSFGVAAGCSLGACEHGARAFTCTVGGKTSSCLAHDGDLVAAKGGAAVTLGCADGAVSISMGGG